MENEFEFDSHLIVPLILRIKLINIFVSTEYTLDLIKGPPWRNLLDLLDIAVAVDGVLGV